MGHMENALIGLVACEDKRHTAEKNKAWTKEALKDIGLTAANLIAEAEGCVEVQGGARLCGARSLPEASAAGGLCGGRGWGGSQRLHSMASRQSSVCLIPVTCFVVCLNT